jgi:hypothetical protein
MLNKEQIYELIQKTFNSLKQSDMIEEDVTVSGDMVLLGTDSVLDSIAYVTFITEMEDRLMAATDSELFLVMDEIHDFNSENYSNDLLTVAALAEFILKLISRT